MTARAFLLVIVLLLPGVASAEPISSGEPDSASLSSQGAVPASLSRQEAVPASFGEPYTEELAAVPASQDPVCEANDPATAAAVLQGSRAIEAMAERMQAEFQAGGDAPIVLNNRGYGYGIQQGTDPAQLMRVLEREAAAAR